MGQSEYVSQRRGYLSVAGVGQQLQAVPQQYEQLKLSVR